MLNDLQPGCFGSALTFRAETQECKTCPFFTNCGPLSLQSLERLRGKLGITVKARKPKVVKPVVYPKRVKDIVKNIKTAGIDVTGRLARRECPFDAPRYLRLVSQELIDASTKGCSPDDLQKAASLSFAWDVPKATKYVTEALQVLQALGVTEEKDGSVFLKV
jgi:hypothetical protein